MTVHYTHGDLFASGADALVNPVNCKGAWEAGVSAEFAERYPAAFEDFKAATWLRPGGLVTHRTEGGPLILSIAIKDHWKNSRLIDSVRVGLWGLRGVVDLYGLRTVAIPASAVGHGLQPWLAIKRLVDEFLWDVPATVMVYVPKGEKP